jgi:hypothetical protein
MVPDTPVVPNEYLEPYFDSEEKKALQRLAHGTVDASVAEVQPQIDTLSQQIADFTVSPVPFRFVATGGQTDFIINGVAADSGELVLVHKNGTYLHLVNDYTTAFTVGPETTTITLVTPATGGDIIAGVVYNIVAVTGGGGGATVLDDLTDVFISGPVTGEVLKYNATLNRWENQPDATGGGGGATNLTFSRDATTVTVESDTGTDAALPSATTSLAGVLSATDKTKLDGIASGATVNATDAALRDRSTHTGTQLASTISDLQEAVQDVVGAFVVQGSGITVTYNDGANTLTIAATGGTGTPDFILQSYGVI